MLSWKLDVPIFGVAALVAGDAAAFWSANNPSIFTTRSFRSKHGIEAENTAEDIRLGGMFGTMLAVLVAVGGAIVAGQHERGGRRLTVNVWPLIAVAIVLVFQWAVYEWSLANPHGLRQSIADQKMGGQE